MTNKQRMFSLKSKEIKTMRHLAYKISKIF